MSEVVEFCADLALENHLTYIIILNEDVLECACWLTVKHIFI